MNQKLFLDENNTFKYDNTICSLCGSHKLIKKGALMKINKILMEKPQNLKNSNIGTKNVGKFGIYNNPLIGEHKQFFTRNNG